MTTPAELTDPELERTTTADAILDGSTWLEAAHLADPALARILTAWRHAKATGGLRGACKPFTDAPDLYAHDGLLEALEATGSPNPRRDWRISARITEHPVAPTARERHRLETLAAARARLEALETERLETLQQIGQR